MKKIFSLQLYVWLFLTILFSQCTKVDLEEGVRKTTILRHNYIAITTKDDVPGEVEVRYSILGNNGQNEVKTERLSTPCVIGGEKVLVAYDSIVATSSGRRVFSLLTLNRDYQENGADFLSIKNLSSTTLEYAVIGNQPLVFHNPADLKEYHNFTNLNEIDKTKVVKESPTPINSEGIPVLYLLKPELSKINQYYILLSIGDCVNGELTTVESTYAKHIGIKSTQYTIREIMNFYKKEYSQGKTLFVDYSDYNAKCQKYKGLARLDIKFYGEIQPESFVRNTGQIWFINTPSEMKGNDTFKIFR